MKKIKLPSNVEYIIHQLERAGYEAYAVGGCVRDSLLGRVPGDWDITTSARPEQVKAVFRRTIDTGIQHGTVTVLMLAEQAGAKSAPVWEGYDDRYWKQLYKMYEDEAKEAEEKK